MTTKNQRRVSGRSAISTWERRNWRGQRQDPLRERLRRLQSAYGDGLGGVGCLAGELAVVLDDRRIDMSDKALGMLKHMRKQILGHPAPYVVVRGAAISIGVDPEGSECDGLIDELLRDGHLQRYPSPSLTAHGQYRLPALGISAADEAA